MKKLFETDPLQRSAFMDGEYRFALERRWAEGPSLLFCMLNPSTADGMKDDPTIRRCVGFAKFNQFAALAVVNLYAFRATEPELVFKAADPVGLGNDTYIDKYAKACGGIVAAWGTLGHPDRVRDVMRILEAHQPVYCLGRTKDGHPRHPLYVDGKRKLERFTLEGTA